MKPYAIVITSVIEDVIIGHGLRIVQEQQTKAFKAAQKEYKRKPTKRNRTQIRILRMNLLRCAELLEQADRSTPHPLLVHALKPK